MDRISLRAAVKSWLHRYKIPWRSSLLSWILTSVVITEKVLEISENPAFCGKNCHIMRPYYDSWENIFS